MCGFLFLVFDLVKDGGFLSVFMGIKGLLIVFLLVFVIVIVYNFCVKCNIIIKMLKEVLLNIL